MTTTLDPRGVRPAPATREFQRRRMWIVARTELRQLRTSRDFWIPMVALGSLFFVVVPTILLLVITRIGRIDTVQQVSQALAILPESAQAQLQGDTPAPRTAYALAVYLFAPVAVVVPLTISTAVGAASLVGERERGTGEFLAHSPASVREIYLGKLVASFVPGYLTTLVGFGTYSLMVNLIVGPQTGGWFFPTSEWLVMMFWIIPPFLLLTLSLVLRLSARVKSTAAAQQASGLITLPLIGIAYSQATGTLMGSAWWTGWALGAAVWVTGAWSLHRGVRSVTRNRLLGVAQYEGAREQVGDRAEPVRLRREGACSGRGLGGDDVLGGGQGALGCGAHLVGAAPVLEDLDPGGGLELDERGDGSGDLGQGVSDGGTVLRPDAVERGVARDEELGEPGRVGWCGCCGGGAQEGAGECDGRGREAGERATWHEVSSRRVGRRRAGGATVDPRTSCSGMAQVMAPGHGVHATDE